VARETMMLVEASGPEGWPGRATAAARLERVEAPEGIADEEL